MAGSGSGADAGGPGAHRHGGRGAGAIRYSAAVGSTWLVGPPASLGPPREGRSLADLVAWGVDGALVREPPSVPGWSAQPLWSEPVALYVGPDGHDWDGAAPDFEQLLGDRPLLLDAEAPYNDALLARLAQSGYRPRTMSVDQGGVVKRLVAEGLGVTILPTGSVFREVVEGRLVEVPGPDLSLLRDTVWWMTPHERARTFALQVAEQLLGQRQRGVTSRRSPGADA